MNLSLVMYTTHQGLLNFDPRVLLWHRSDNLVFALVLGGASMITVGEGVECKIKGVLQVFTRAMASSKHHSPAQSSRIISGG